MEAEIHAKLLPIVANSDNTTTTQHLSTVRGLNARRQTILWGYTWHQFHQECVTKWVNYYTFVVVWQKHKYNVCTWLPDASSVSVQFDDVSSTDDKLDEAERRFGVEVLAQ